jgi:tetratricopeptide (TPR) repeat protein
MRHRPKEQEISKNEPGISHNNLGNSCMEMQKYSQAFEHFQKSISNQFLLLIQLDTETFEDISVLHMKSAFCLLQLYKFKESIEHSEKAINTDPNLLKVILTIFNLRLI